jgi:hypothetical protein
MNHLSLIQLCNTRIQSSPVNDDPNETLQQTHNTEQSISDDPQEPRQELTHAQRVQGLPGPEILAAGDIFQQITEKEHIFQNYPPGDKSNCWFLMDNGATLTQAIGSGPTMTIVVFRIAAKADAMTNLII